jgi:hypothetical protein
MIGRIERTFCVGTGTGGLFLHTSPPFSKSFMGAASANRRPIFYDYNKSFGKTYCEMTDPQIIRLMAAILAAGSDVLPLDERGRGPQYHAQAEKTRRDEEALCRAGAAVFFSFTGAGLRYGWTGYLAGGSV